MSHDRYPSQIALFTYYLSGYRCFCVLPSEHPWPECPCSATSNSDSFSIHLAVNKHYSALAALASAPFFSLLDCSRVSLVIKVVVPAVCPRQSLSNSSLRLYLSARTSVRYLLLTPAALRNFEAAA